MNRLGMLAILVGSMMALAALSSAQDEEPEATDSPPPAAEDSAPPPAPNPDDVFIPTEELPVDEEVTFPVTI
jgi:hypothetical protein